MPDPQPAKRTPSPVPPCKPDAAIRYAELHCCTNFSFLEGASHPDELVARAAELGYAALAITDRASLAGGGGAGGRRVKSGRGTVRSRARPLFPPPPRAWGGERVGGGGIGPARGRIPLTLPSPPQSRGRGWKKEPCANSLATASCSPIAVMPSPNCTMARKIGAGSAKCGTWRAKPACRWWRPTLCITTFARVVHSTTC